MTKNMRNMTMLAESILYREASAIHDQLRMIVQQKNKDIHIILLDRLTNLFNDEASRRNKSKLFDFIEEYSEEIFKEYKDCCANSDERSYSLK